MRSIMRIYVVADYIACTERKREMRKDLQALMPSLNHPSFPSFPAALGPLQAQARIVIPNPHWASVPSVLLRLIPCSSKLNQHDKGAVTDLGYARLIHHHGNGRLFHSLVSVPILR